MPRLSAVAAPATLPVLAAAALLAGCGEKTIVPEGAEKSVTDLVRSQTGFAANDVECPSGVEATVGTTFECSFTGPEGPYVAKMRVLEVDGEAVQFRIDTERAP